MPRRVRVFTFIKFTLTVIYTVRYTVFVSLFLVLLASFLIFLLDEHFIPKENKKPNIIQCIEALLSGEHYLFSTSVHSECDHGRSLRIPPAVSEP